jgi:hypothetical protein
VALLRPDSFWGVQAFRDHYSAEHGRWWIKECRIAFASWGDAPDMKLDALVRRLESIGCRGLELPVDRAAQELLVELRARGLPAARALLDAYRKASEQDDRVWLLHCLGQLCAWSDARQVVVRFLGAERGGLLAREPQWAVDFLEASIDGAHFNERQMRSPNVPEQPPSQASKQGDRTQEDEAIGWLLLGAMASVGFAVALALVLRHRGRREQRESARARPGDWPASNGGPRESGDP